MVRHWLMDYFLVIFGACWTQTKKCICITSKWYVWHKCKVSLYIYIYIYDYTLKTEKQSIRPHISPHSTVMLQYKIKQHEEIIIDFLTVIMIIKQWSIYTSTHTHKNVADTLVFVYYCWCVCACVWACVCVCRIVNEDPGKQMGVYRWGTGWTKAKLFLIN